VITFDYICTVKHTNLSHDCVCNRRFHNAPIERQSGLRRLEPSRSLQVHNLAGHPNFGITHPANMSTPAGTNTSSTMNNDKSGSRLSDQQKKKNHILSEAKRREAIRAEFDRLATLVPGMEGQGRSEAVVLQATVEFMREQVGRKEELRVEARR